MIDSPSQQLRVIEEFGYYLILDGNGNYYAKTYSSMDASKIAAIPDLLAACKAALDASIGSHNHWDATMQHGGGCPLCIRQKEARRILLAAFAKATGEPAQ